MSCIDPLPTIMGAYYRRTGEDRATEVLATVLDRSPAFVGQLADRLQLERAGAYEVKTQVVMKTQVGDRCIIDLEIQAHASDGRPVWLLWSEHKVADPLTFEQLSNEANALELKAGAVPRKLIAITLYPPTAAVRAHAEVSGIALLRWRDLVGMAQRAVHELAAATPDSTSGQWPREVERHLLLEWCAFCENDLEAPVEPLTQHGVEILADAVKAGETLEHLVDAGFRNASEALGSGPVKDVGDEWHAAAPAGTWLSDQGCKLYARYDIDDSWTVGGTGRPAVVVGTWTDGDDADTLRKRPELRQVLGEQGFSCWDEPGTHGWISFAKTLPLAAVVTTEDLESQERTVQEFCSRVLEELLAVAGA